MLPAVSCYWSTGLRESSIGSAQIAWRLLSIRYGVLWHLNRPRFLIILPQKIPPLMAPILLQMHACMHFADEHAGMGMQKFHFLSFFFFSANHKMLNLWKVCISPGQAVVLELYSLNMICCAIPSSSKNLSVVQFQVPVRRITVAWSECKLTWKVKVQRLKKPPRQVTSAARDIYSESSLLDCNLPVHHQRQIQMLKHGLYYFSIFYVHE